MAKISAWLEQQQRDYVHGALLCNWGATQLQLEERRFWCMSTRAAVFERI
jgi:hypothetical protein